MKSNRTIVEHLIEKCDICIKDCERNIKEATETLKDNTVVAAITWSAENKLRENNALLKEHYANKTYLQGLLKIEKDLLKTFFTQGANVGVFGGDEFETYHKIYFDKETF